MSYEVVYCQVCRTMVFDPESVDSPKKGTKAEASDYDLWMLCPSCKKVQPYTSIPDLCDR